METPAWRRGFLFAPGSLDTGTRGALPRCGRAPGCSPALAPWTQASWRRGTASVGSGRRSVRSIVSSRPCFAPRVKTRSPAMAGLLLSNRRTVRLAGGACMAGPITTWMVPGYLAQPALGQYCPALWAIGSTGSPALTARAVPPRENLPICPTGIRVPSGKISTQAPFFRHSSPCLASCLRASLGWLRSMAMGLSRARAQPKNGT